MEKNNNNGKFLSVWINANQNISYVLSKNTEEDRIVYNKMKIMETSVLGSVCLNYGYILSNNVRLLGGRNNGCVSLLEANELHKGYSIIKDLVIVADTSSGGIFAMNCSNERKAKSGEILFLPANSIEWEQLDMGYTDFVRWILSTSKKELFDGGWIDQMYDQFDFKKADLFLKAKVALLTIV